MVLPFIPNEADATFNDQAEPDSVDFEILLLAFRQTGVVSGCDVTQSSGSEMEIDVASGEALLAGASVTVAAQPDKTIATADGSNPRVDLVTVNSGGTVVVTAGTAAGNPVSPAIPTNSVPLAFVYVPASDTTITNNQISDKRVLLVAGGGASMAFAYNNPDELTGTSSSAFPWKGAAVVPFHDTNIHALIMTGTIVSGATYQSAVMTESGGTIATITKSATHVASSTDAATTNGTMLTVFDPAILLTAGTEYHLVLGRTDASDTEPLRIQYPGTNYQWPFGSLPSNTSLRVAKANPAVSDTVDLITAGVARMGALWELA